MTKTTAKIRLEVIIGYADCAVSCHRSYIRPFFVQLWCIWYKWDDDFFFQMRSSCKKEYVNKNKSQVLTIYVDKAEGGHIFYGKFGDIICEHYEVHIFMDMWAWK